jgi:hypothetical protein
MFNILAMMTASLEATNRIQIANAAKTKPQLMEPELVRLPKSHRSEKRTMAARGTPVKKNSSKYQIESVMICLLCSKSGFSYVSK